MISFQAYITRLPWTIKNAHSELCRSLQRIYEQREAQNIAQIIFEDVFDVRNFERKDFLNLEQAADLRKIEKRLLQQEPWQYVLGMADFYGLKFKVDPRVLIPRPETEELVHWVLAEAKKSKGKEALRVLDIGTGSGCIPVTLKKERSILTVDALDVSQEAIDLATENAALNNTEVSFLTHNILDQAAWSNLGQYDIIISNPPYIPNREKPLMPKHVKAFEPSLALFVEDTEPLVFYRTILDFALSHLLPRGKLFFESNEFNAQEVKTLMEEKGLRNVELRQDFSGKDRMLMGER